MDYLPYKRTTVVLLFYTTLISVELAQYEKKALKLAVSGKGGIKEVFGIHTTSIWAQLFKAS